MKILVTGASGFVGGVLCVRLAHSLDVVGTVRSLLDTPVLEVNYHVVAEMVATTSWLDTLVSMDRPVDNEPCFSLIAASYTDTVRNTQCIMGHANWLTMTRKERSSHRN